MVGQRDLVRWAGAVALLIAGAQGAPAATLDGASLTQTAQAVSAKDARLKEIVEGARKEGRFSLVLGEGGLGGQNSPLLKGFNDYYGLNLDVRFTPGPSMPSMVATVIQQYQAKKPSTTDVITGYANHMIPLIDANAIEKVDWASWAPNIQRPELIAAGGVAVPILSSIPGIAYNSDVFKGDDVPKTFQDLLDPKLKGRVATAPTAGFFGRLATKSLWGKEKTLDFVRKFSVQIGGLIRCNELDRLATGEYDVFGLTCSQSNALRPASKGAPIGFTLASDAPVVLLQYQAVPATAPHPNAAKLWINYMLSKEAQQLLYQAEFMDLHLLEGSKAQELLAKVEANGVQPILFDIDFHRANDASEMDAVTVEAQDILRMKN